MNEFKKKRKTKNKKLLFWNNKDVYLQNKNKINMKIIKRIKDKLTRGNNFVRKHVRIIWFIKKLEICKICVQMWLEDIHSISVTD